MRFVVRHQVRQVLPRGSVNVAQDGDGLWALPNVIMNFGFHTKQRNSEQAEWLSASKNVSNFLQLVTKYTDRFHLSKPHLMTCSCFLRHPDTFSACVQNKGKGVPPQTEVAQWVPGRLRPRIFLTFRHYKGGSSSAIRTGRLYPRRSPWYSLSEAESTSGHMVLTGVPREKSPVTPPGIDSGTVRLVAQCLNHYATPGPLSVCTKFNRKTWKKITLKT